MDNRAELAPLAEELLTLESEMFEIQDYEDVAAEMLGSTSCTSSCSCSSSTTSTTSCTA